MNCVYSFVLCTVPLFPTSRRYPLLCCWCISTILADLWYRVTSVPPTAIARPFRVKIPMFADQFIRTFLIVASRCLILIKPWMRLELLPFTTAISMPNNALNERARCTLRLTIVDCMQGGCRGQVVRLPPGLILPDSFQNARLHGEVREEGHSGLVDS